MYRKSARELIYTGGGHPPAVLVAGPDDTSLTITRLESQGPIIGLALDAPFDTQRITLPDVARLYVFSDGAFEISKLDDTMATLDEFIDFLTVHCAESDLIDQVIAHARQLCGGPHLEDDFSLLQVTF